MARELRGFYEKFNHLIKMGHSDHEAARMAREIPVIPASHY